MSIRRTLKTVSQKWWQRHRRRSALKDRLYELNDTLVEKDIGVPRGTLYREAHKPFWRS